METINKMPLDSPEIFINREMSWLSFARRVLAFAEDPELPLLERVKFAGIMGMLYDEFAMKRIGGIKRAIAKRDDKISSDGLTLQGELRSCQQELHRQMDIVSALVCDELLPALASAGIPILEYSALNKKQRSLMEKYFRESVEPILTPLAVDVSHPFPFISNLGLNLAIELTEDKKKRRRFVRIKVPANRPRWVSLPGEGGFVPLEQVIAANVPSMFPSAAGLTCYFFRVTRGAKDNPWDHEYLEDLEIDLAPGYIIGMVSAELEARKYAGVVRLQVSHDMPAKLQKWLAEQLGAASEDILPMRGIIGLCDLMEFSAEGYPHLHNPPHNPVTHQRLAGLDPNPDAIFEEIRRGDILLHLPYDNFDTSILRFLQSAAADPKVLAIKLTIYRTSRKSPIIMALLDAARRGKQVAVLVEITARFDEAPNIAWGKMLEQGGVHVAYGMERLKTHVKLALVVREEDGVIRRYVHVGTGNYHAGTARLYEDLGILSCDQELGDDVAALFNELTTAIPYSSYKKLMVAPHDMRQRFTELIRREARNSEAGLPAGIRAKMNQLQDSEIIRELYRASQSGVPITLNVRGMCCLRAQVPGLSENIRVYSTLGRFLEHGRIYRFENNGQPEFFIGSADWMRRNLDRRMESIMAVTNPKIKKQLEEILTVYENDNCSAWDLQADNSYQLRQPAKDEPCRAAQQQFIDLAGNKAGNIG